MLTRIYADWHALPQTRRAALESTNAHFRSILLEPFPEPNRNSRFNATLSHAVSFWTWRSLCHDNGLSDDDAVEVMSTLITTAVRAPETPDAPMPENADVRGQ
ncbi:hypothetical protein SRABI26_03535 [Arthrobacter sp. Bi26]|uniref:hypothetical protein n=1 Tax=Arthrobacter sp. Bi26 TaxID=2822350 RepID=UPI001DB3EF4B|nr:hypothetical protein [Arthrobacter sp. Bi26]CAH0266444.1 hypothetical protein SRABI26_03535 [Arthrobacter sp. Bi26]